MAKQSWDTCIFGEFVDSDFYKEIKKYGLHQRYLCNNEKIIKLGVYPLFPIVQDSGGRFHRPRYVAQLQDATDFDFELNGKALSEKDVKEQLKKSLAGCTHCKFYGEK